MSLRVSVAIQLEISEEGIITPLAVVYEGKKYDVDRVLKVESYHGDRQGLFTVKIGQHTRYLFHEGYRWFIQSVKTIRIM